MNKKLRFIAPTVLLLLVANIGMTSFLLFKTQPTPTNKYVDTERISTIIYNEIFETIKNMSQSRIKEIEVLQGQIKLIEDKKKVKGYLDKKETKQLDKKKTQLKNLEKNLQEQQYKMMNSMFISKQKKINEILAKLSKKYNCTIHPDISLSQQQQLFKVTITPKEDITDDVMRELGISEQTKKKDKK